jgi:molecular chaperone GrpE
MTPKHTRQHSQASEPRHASEQRTDDKDPAQNQPGGGEVDSAEPRDPNEDGGASAEGSVSAAEAANGADGAGADESDDVTSPGGQADDGAARELEATRDRYLRLAAEFDNYRKRTERERTENTTRAQAQLVERLLDAIDDLQRVAHLDAEKTSASSVLEGVQMVERKLLRILEGAGLEILEAEGKPFDPEVHEAIATAPAEQGDQDDTVSDVFQKGYLFKGTLIRPARVRVYKHEG